MQAEVIIKLPDSSQRGTTGCGSPCRSPDHLLEENGASNFSRQNEITDRRAVVAGGEKLLIEQQSDLARPEARESLTSLTFA